MTSPAEASTEHEENAKLFMGLFLGSWSIGFIALLLALLYIRLQAVSWPPAGAPEPPRLLTGLSTAIVLLSSATYHYGLVGIERGLRRRLAHGLLISATLAFVFLLTQLAAAAQALARGLAWDTDVYASFFWVTAGFHYAHVIVGFAAASWLFVRTQSGAFSGRDHLVVRLWGYYWHSMGAVWVLIYLFVFLL